MPKISRYTRKAERDARNAIKTEQERIKVESFNPNGRPKGSGKTPEQLIEHDIKRIQKLALKELKEKAETLKDMQIEDLLKVLKSCGDALKGVKQIRFMETDQKDHTIKFITHMAERGK